MPKSTDNKEKNKILPPKKKLLKDDAKKTVAKKPAEKKTAEKKPTPKKTAPKKQKTEKKPNEKWNIKYLGGMLFAKMMRGGASELRANAEEVNKLNVFPVPDGDTGDNMRMTIDSGIAAIENLDSDDLAEVMKFVSHGMLLGARGNSGVILSQFFSGIAKGLEDTEKADATMIGRALELGVKQAYTSVMTPTEGTILTVAREAVEYAVSRITPKSTVRTLFSDLVREMHASVDRTPELLAALKEAGVVDSGGAGLFYIMDGINRVLNGEDIPEVNTKEDKAAHPSLPANAASFGPDSVMTFGYCTELLVQLQTSKTDIENFDIEPTKAFLATIGDSIVAFKTDSIVKIHVHTLTPEKVLEHLRQYGEFLTVKIENMSLQHTELENEGNEPVKEEVKQRPKEKKKYAVVAVSNGDGITELFREFGADEVVEGGQTKNPSTNDFIDAFKRINAEHIFVFPNNGNIVMAACQAAEIYEDAKVHVTSAKTIGSCYVALSSMNFEAESAEEILKDAEEAIARITSSYISPAIRDVDMNGIHVEEGDTIGIIAKEIVISEKAQKDAVFGLVDKLLESGDKFMLTAFCGIDAPMEEREALEEHIHEKYPEVEAYFIDGKQEVYPYLIVVE